MKRAYSIFALLVITLVSIHGQLVVKENTNKVGIGTLDPDWTLHVKTPSTENVVAKFEGAACAAQLSFLASGAGGNEWKFMSTADCATLGGGKFTIFQQGVAHRFVIDPSGNIGMGQTSPQHPLHISRVNTKEIVKIDGNYQSTRLVMNNDHSNQNVGFQFRTGNVKKWSPAAYNDNGGNVDFTFWNDQLGKAGLRIDGTTNNAEFDGSVTANDILLTSDKHLKKNIRAYKRSLAKVMELRPVTFQYKNGDGKTKIGIIAQELQKIEPTIVSERVIYEVIKGLNPTGKTSTHLQIQADAVQYMLVRALQEQQAIIEDQQVQIDELKERFKTSEEVDKDKSFITRVTFDSNSEETPTLSQNIPNASENTKSIEYYLPEGTQSAQLQFYNNLGALIKSVDLNSTGKGEVILELDNLNSGTYNYSLLINGKLVDTKKMIISK